jgi:TolB protein
MLMLKASRSPFRFSVFFTAICALFGAEAALVGQQSIVIPEITREGKQDAITLKVVSNDEGIQALATRAFNAHGAFDASSDGTPLYLLKLDLDADGRVSYVLQRNQPLTEVAKGAIKSNRWHLATLRICDVIVEKTAKLNGFFAGKLAFVGRRDGFRELYVGDLFFQQVDQLTRDKSYSLNPSWSPDGLKILYTGYFRTGFPDIFLVDVLSGQRSMFATYKGSNTGAEFSKDGAEVAMVLSSSRSSEIYIADAFGRNPKRITENRSSELSPSWSPDGKMLAVTSDQMGTPQIFVLNRASGAMERVRITVSQYCAEPAWNPVDPDWIALTIGVKQTFQIAIHNLKTGETRVLTEHTGDGVEPAWMADGRHLVYTVREGGTKRLQLIDSATGHTAALHSPRFGEASEAAFVYPF